MPMMSVMDTRTPGAGSMKVGIAEFRNDMADALNRVAYSGDRVILERRGKPVAALVSVEDLELLETLEDREDVRAARKVGCGRWERTGEKPIPWEQVKEELGL